MAQIKIYGLKSTLNPIKAQLSDVIHNCVVEALKFPVDKRAHRFFPLDAADFYYPAGRSEHYIIIEIVMIEGRTVAYSRASFTTSSADIPIHCATFSGG